MGEKGRKSEKWAPVAVLTMRTGRRAAPPIPSSPSPEETGYTNGTCFVTFVRPHHAPTTLKAERAPAAAGEAKKVVVDI